MHIKKNSIPKAILLYGLLPSFVKKVIYRLKGYKVGNKVNFKFGSVIIGKDVIIGDNCKFEFFSVIRAKKINIKRFVNIHRSTMIDTEELILGEDTTIKENVNVGGMNTPDSSLKTGKRVYIGQNSYINTTKPVILGDDTGLGGYNFLFTHGSWLSQLDGFPATFEPIIIGSRVWAPWRVFIMPGITIGNDVVIGANSLITKSLPSNVLAAGSPAKIIYEDYPKNIDKNQRVNIINNIIEDFISYFEYNGYSHDKLDEKHIISKNGKKAEFIISLNSLNYEFTCDDHVLICDNEKMLTSDYKMVLNLHKNKRIGSSKIGEELVKFFSRYGIRFNRID